MNTRFSGRKNYQCNTLKEAKLIASFLFVFIYCTII